LKKHFPDESIKVISEPGTYFVERAFTLATNVHSKCVKKDKNGENVFNYFITDSIYQSFRNKSVYNHPIFMRTLKNFDDTTLKKSVVWGRALEPHDVILRDVQLPELSCGDWLIFDDAGAYKIATCCSFNGFENHPIYSFISKKYSRTLQII
jgi:ornithine decarboxylase